MDTLKFNKLVAERCDKIAAVMVKKGDEYSKPENKLHNFDNSSRIAGITRERALDGMLLKHYTSYRDMLDQIDAGVIPTDAMIDEKIGDIINYFILFEACVKHRNTCQE
jgi:hypothetical protein